MTDISYIDFSILSDVAIEQTIGHYIKRLRQQQRRTQVEVAKAASISRSTLSLLERGETVTLKTLIQVLRVLDQLQVLQGFAIKDQISPLALAKLQHKPKERVRKKTKAGKKVKTKKSNW